MVNAILVDKTLNLSLNVGITTLKHLLNVFPILSATNKKIYYVLFLAKIWNNACCKRGKGIDFQNLFDNRNTAKGLLYEWFASAVINHDTVRLAVVEFANQSNAPHKHIGLFKWFWKFGTLGVTQNFIK